jgi:integrase
MASIEARLRQPDGTWRTLKGPELKDPALTRNATWRAMVRLKGHPAKTESFERKRDAEQWAQRTEAAIREGRRFPERAATRRTVDDLLKQYIADKCPGRKDSATRTQQLTYWREQLGHLALVDLTPSVINKATSELLATPTRYGRARSPATANRYLAALSHALSVAVKEWEWLEASPMARVTKQREPRGRTRYLDDGKHGDNERARLLAACDAGPAYLRPVVTLALATGMRRGEILGLRWHDVDLTTGNVTLWETKNGERRVVPVTGDALKVLKTWGKSQPEDRSRHVFTETSSFHHAFERAVERAGIEDFNFHDLRHTCASHLAMSGAPLLDIAAILGHKQLSMVKRYAHLSPTHLRGVLERANARVEGSSRR